MKFGPVVCVPGATSRTRHTQAYRLLEYRRTTVSADSVFAVSVIRGWSRPEKFSKTKEINASYGSKSAPSENGP